VLLVLTMVQVCSRFGGSTQFGASRTIIAVVIMATNIALMDLTATKGV
jgi:hypothetical protein